MSFVARMLNWYNWFNRMNQKFVYEIKTRIFILVRIYMLEIVYKMNQCLSQYLYFLWINIVIKFVVRIRLYKHYFVNLFDHSENLKTNTNILHNYLKNQLRGVVSVSQIKWICDLRHYATKQNITQNIYLVT